MEPKVIKRADGEALDVQGDRLRLKLGGSDTDRQFCVTEHHFDPGSGSPRHIHDGFDHLAYITAGGFRFSIGTNEQDLSTGDLVLVPRGTPHSFSALGSNTSTMLVVTFPADLEDLMADLSSLPGPPFNPKDVSETLGRHGTRQVE